ncbi:5400_t:CDS:2, partial [Scutellospora calospora]
MSSINASKKSKNPINPDTRFRKFNFTLYERLETFHDHVEKIFNTKNCPFKLLQFQFEPNKNASEPGRYHAQGFVKLRERTQQRVGEYNSETKKGSGLKKIFEANVHFEFANSTEEECLAYTSKDHDRCKLLEHNPNPKKGLKCKCDFKDLSKICSYCNENCERPFARIDQDTTIAGPFLFIFDEFQFEKEKPNFYKEAIVKVLKGENVDEGHTINGLRDIAKSQKKKIINPLRNIKRYWEPCVFYVYGDNGTRKSDFCSQLFPGLYERDDMKQWEEYNNDDFDYDRDIGILIDDFYGGMSWTNLLKLTDRKHCRFDVKYDKTQI